MPPLDRQVSRGFAVELLTSAFCQAIVWWFENDTLCTPEELADWFLLVR